MKVCDLIELLSKLPSYLEVQIESSAGEYSPDDISHVYIIQEDKKVSLMLSSSCPYLYHSDLTIIETLRSEE